MSINDNVKIEYESGQSAAPWEEMTSVDNQNYSSTFSPWSGRSGYEATVSPYGMNSGGTISPGAADDTVDVTAIEATMPGIASAAADGTVSVGAAAGVAVARPSTNDYLINSITVDNLGAIVVVSGAESTAFSEVRGDPGGPPFIPVDSVEVGQVRYMSQVAGPVSDDDIVDVPNVTRENSDFPINTVNEADGTVQFAQPLPLIHTGGLAKQVWVKGYTPIFAEQPQCSDWVPAETTNSVNSTEIYGGAIGSVSSTIGQAGWTTYLKDGITDNIVQQKNERLWVKVTQDRNRPPYQLTQGKLGIARTYPVGEKVQAAMTVSAEDPTVDFAS
jgi:hypothetical protein